MGKQMEHFDNLQFEIYEMIRDGLSYFYLKNSKSVSRSDLITAEILHVLRLCGETTERPHWKVPTEWLLDQAFKNEGENKYNWSNNIWQTGLTLMAIGPTVDTRDPSTKLFFRIKGAIEWIQENYGESKTKGKISDKSLYNQSFSLTYAPGFDKIISSKLGGICEMAKAKTKARYNFGYGAIYQRKTKKGKIRWYLDYRDASGKRIQKVAPLATTKEEAEFALRDEIRKVFDHEYRVRREKKGIKFKDLAEDYLENYAKVNKKSWKDDYYRLRFSIIPFFGEIEFSDITPLMIEKYRAKRLNEKISKSTVNREISIMRKMFNLAIDWKIAEENPAAKVKFFSEKDTLKERILDPEEENKLLCEANDYLKLILIMALNTGIRRGEILKLKWEHVDFKEKHILVKNTKSGKNRIFPINNVLFIELLKIRESAKRTPFVFPNPKTGKPYTSLKTGFKSACKRASLENLRFHDLRHTFATRLVQSGVDLITVRDLLGHFSINMTQRYTHTNRDQKINAVELLKKNKAEKECKKTGNLLHICDMGTKRKTGKTVSDSYLIN